VDRFRRQSTRGGGTLWCVEEPDLSVNGEPPWPVVVIGAGAAGLFAGMFAAMKGARVLILESKEKPGAKIRVSGGGRCNILPSEVALENFHCSGSNSTPNMRRSFLAQYSAEPILSTEGTLWGAAEPLLLGGKMAVGAPVPDPTLVPG